KLNMVTSKKLTLAVEMEIQSRLLPPTAETRHRSSQADQPRCSRLISARNTFPIMQLHAFDSPLVILPTSKSPKGVIIRAVSVSSHECAARTGVGRKQIS